MIFTDKIVTEIPLQNIWNSEKEMDIQRTEYLTKERLKEILTSGPVDFVLADLGNKLKWIETSDCYNYWKTEVERDLADNVKKIYLDDFPDEYAYIASYWTCDMQKPIILLEKYH